MLELLTEYGLNIGDAGGIGSTVFIALVALKTLFTKSPKSTAPANIKTSKQASPKVVKETTKKAEPVKVSFASRLSKGLEKTRSEIWGKVASLVGTGLDDDKLEQIEEILYSSDMPHKIIDEVVTSIKNKGKLTELELKELLFETLETKLVSAQSLVNPELYRFDKKSDKMKVIMIVGVNGAGKTTTIGKLATRLKDQGAKVVVGACDTFRAAAVEQLEVWCKRADVEMIRANDGADPSGVAFDTVKKAVELGADYCLIDTAGRLHTKSNLMDELAKTKKVMSKVVSDAPHEVLLVIDAITGQSAMRQAEEFNKSLALSGLIFTKCDGSAKAGSAIGIVDQLNVPIVYIGVGEDVEDLDVFETKQYLGALLGHQENAVH